MIFLTISANLALEGGICLMPRSDGEKMAAKWSKLDPQTNNRTLYYAIAIVAILAIIAIVAVAVFALTQDNTTGAQDSQTPKPIQDTDGEIYHNIKVMSKQASASGYRSLKL